MSDDLILVRAWSGPWESPDERIGLALAELAVYMDGTVVADVSPVADVRDVRAVRLDPDELRELLEGIADIAPEPVDQASSLNSGCADGGAQVIWVRVDRRPVELAVYCLSTEIDAVMEGTPPAAVALSRILDELEHLVRDRDPITTDKLLPLVPAAPHVGG